MLKANIKINDWDTVVEACKHFGVVPDEELRKRYETLKVQWIKFITDAQLKGVRSSSTGDITIRPIEKRDGFGL